MDGLRGVWHAGPFTPNARFRFYPKQIMFGTDPVAMDRLLIDVIEDKRKAEGAVSLFERSPTITSGDNSDPNKNRFIREPGHVEYAAKLGLGVYDKAQIKMKDDRTVMLLLLAAALPALFWDGGPETLRATRRTPGSHRSPSRRRAWKPGRASPAIKADSVRSARRRQAAGPVGEFPHRSGVRDPRSLARFQRLAISAAARPARFYYDAPGTAAAARRR